MLDTATRLEMHELAARYGNVMDAREWDRLPALFTEDAVFTLAARHGAERQRWQGLPAIRAMLESAKHPIAHHVTNVEVLDGDPVRLRFKVAGPAPAGTVGSADYEDVLRDGPGGWRIAEHHVTLRSSAVQHATLRKAEAQLAIQQLAVRYAQAVDARDLDLMVEQWNSDAWMGRQHGAGREAVRSFFTPVLQQFYRSIHMIVGHRIDLVDRDTATGEVYCRAEHESGDSWIVQAIVYHDSYRRVDGRWGFAKRVHQHWYSSPVERAPAGPSFEQWPGWNGPLPDLPHAWPSWHRFWDDAGAEAVAAVTRHPGAAS